MATRQPSLSFGGGAKWAIHLGDVADVLAGFEPCSFDALLSDPPYGLSFMGARWDYDVPSVPMWRAILRVLRPGAPILACGGTRTYHRLVLAMEDAGAEIRDQLAWMYGSGFPKSQNPIRSGAGSEWDGYGTALKPAHEPIVLARKPLAGTLAANIAAHGCGPLAIDACRVRDEVSPERVAGKGRAVYSHEGLGITPERTGRWPANVILDEEAGAALDAQSGQSTSTAAPRHNGAYQSVAKGADAARVSTAGYNDSGGASRFFYCAKASRSEREAGLDDLELVAAHDIIKRAKGSAGMRSPRAGAGRTSNGRRNVHLTVKPIALTRYLSRLIQPAGVGGRILVPFSGVGSEVIGALLEGWGEVVGVERESEYVRIARARIAHWTARGGAE
jgi:DNA modification methylase